MLQYRHKLERRCRFSLYRDNAQNVGENAAPEVSKTRHEQLEGVHEFFSNYAVLEGSEQTDFRDLVGLNTILDFIQDRLR